jgi:drug/metabolite transporter (DMT)-like permease
MAAVGWGLSSIFASPAARRDSPLAVTFWSQLLGLLCGLSVLLFVNNRMSVGSVVHGAIAGLGSGISLLLFYSSTRYLYVGVASAMSAVVACIIPVAYEASTGPTSAREAVGVTVCVVALLAVARWRGDSRADEAQPLTVGGNPGPGAMALVGAPGRVRQEILGIGAALTSGFGMGLYYIALAGTSRGQQVGEALESRLVSVAVLLAIALLTKRSSLAPPRRTFFSALATGVLGVAGAISYATAVRTGNLDVIVPIVSLSPAVTIAVAWLVFSEHVSRRQLAGLALALVGVVIVTA